MADVSKEETIDAPDSASLARKWEEVARHFTNAKITIATDAAHEFPKVSQLKLAGCLAYFYNNQPLAAYPQIEITDGLADISVNNRIATLSGHFSATDASGKVLISNGRLVEPFGMAENDLGDELEADEPASRSMRQSVS